MLDRLARLAPLTGILAVGLLIVGTLLMGTFDYFPTAARAHEIVAANPTPVYVGALLVGFWGGFSLLWFVGSVFDALRQRDGGSGRLAMISLAGGVVAVIGLAISASIIWVAAARADRPGGIGPDQARLLYDLYATLAASVVSIGLAAFIGAAGIGALRAAHVFPAWLQWASVEIAIGLLTPVHYIFEGLAFAWIALVSVVLYRRDNRATTLAGIGGG